MTTNQLKYWQLEEEKRSNRFKESEEHRKNTLNAITSTLGNLISAGGRIGGTLLKSGSSGKTIIRI